MRPAVRTLRLPALVLLCASAAGCGLLDPLKPPDGGAASTDLAYGYGKPTLQITVSGVHFGPAAPDSGTSAQYANQRDGSGRIITSRFTLLGSVSGATCAIAFERVGAGGITPIGASSYFIGSGASPTTPDGTVAPTQTQAVVVPGYALGCAGNGCSGGAFVLSALDDKHVEGYVSGTWADTQGRGSANVACSFYLPLAVYQP